MAQFLWLGEVALNLDLVLDAQWVPDADTITLRFAVPDANGAGTHTYSGDIARLLQRWFANHGTTNQLEVGAAQRITHSPPAVEPPPRSKQKSVLECPLSFYTD